MKLEVIVDVLTSSQRILNGQVVETYSALDSNQLCCLTYHVGVPPETMAYTWCFKIIDVKALVGNKDANFIQ